MRITRGCFKLYCRANGMLKKRIRPILDSHKTIMDYNKKGLSSSSQLKETQLHDPFLERRESDGYINISNVCNASHKNFGKWRSMKKSEEFLNVLSLTTNIPVESLIRSDMYIWVHPQIATNVAHWIDTRTGVAVTSWLMSKKVDIEEVKKYSIMEEENRRYKIQIQNLINKYVKLQPRVQYTKQNVIYIITTKLLKKEGRYILGKAANLTNRLSTYNKSDEHQVIYYQECPDPSTMSIVESLVFQKLKDYREQANRERFVLPKGKSIHIFQHSIKECIAFCTK